MTCLVQLHEVSLNLSMLKVVVHKDELVDRIFKYMVHLTAYLQVFKMREMSYSDVTK